MTGSGINRAAYARVAQHWDAARTAPVGREQAYLDALLDGLPPGASVLDLGCGTGRPIAAQLLARGYRVTGVDQVPELLALARARMPQATWLESRLETFAPREPHAAVVLWDVLFHIERERQREILAAMARSLAPGGRMMLSSGGSAHPPFTDTMFGETFYYDAMPPDALLELLGDLRFQPLVAELANVPDGRRDKGRFAIVAALR